MAYDKRGYWRLAADVTDEDGSFLCPECKQEVIFRHGAVMPWHFAHYPQSQCKYRVAGESPAHYQAKMGIKRALASKPDVTEISHETLIGNLRPDLTAIIRGQRVAIEIQLSDTMLREIRAKLAHYTARNVATLYIVRDIPDGTYTPPEWIRYLHAMYRQTLYTWFDSDTVRLVHLGAYDYSPGMLCTPAFYRQARPVLKRLLPLSVIDFDMEVRSEAELIDRHVGIVDAWLWHHQLDMWWIDIERSLHGLRLST